MMEASTPWQLRCEPGPDQTQRSGVEGSCPKEGKSMEPWKLLCRYWPAIGNPSATRRKILTVGGGGGGRGLMVRVEVTMVVSVSMEVKIEVTLVVIVVDWSD